jgi:hypothetical protein
MKDKRMPQKAILILYAGWDNLQESKMNSEKSLF